jgi:hypothetical protein
MSNVPESRPSLTAVLDGYRRAGVKRRLMEADEGVQEQKQVSRWLTLYTRTMRDHIDHTQRWFVHQIQYQSQVPSTSPPAASGCRDRGELSSVCFKP